jgi:hypothetical protein
MANPTTNYGFVLPTATDLVTDLPADFDVALQGVDTRLKALQPGTTLGDLAYSSATANTNTRLGVGTNGQVLAVSGGVPAWTTTADVTPLTTKGDLFTFTTVDARLGVGANNTVLMADSAEATGLKWAASATVGPTFSALRASTDQSFSSSTFTKGQFQSEYFDLGSCYDATTNYRFTPTTAGIYLVTFITEISSGTGQTLVQIYKNGSNYTTPVNTPSATLSFESAAVPVSMNGSTDYLELFVYNTGTSPLLKAGASQFSVAYLRSN